MMTATSDTAASESDLGRDVRELMDREELRELHMRYSMACDDRRIDDIADCFAPDGVLAHKEADVQGRESIGKFYAARLACYGPTYHYPHASIYEIDGDTATGIILGHAELSIDGVTYKAAVRYYDTYRRDDRWLLTNRVIKNLYFSPEAELPGIFADENRIRWPGEPRPADFPEGDPSWEEFARRK
jgi:hypothetical protein